MDVRYTGYLKYDGSAQFNTIDNFEIQDGTITTGNEFTFDDNAIIDDFTSLD